METNESLQTADPQPGDLLSQRPPHGAQGRSRTLRAGPHSGPKGFRPATTWHWWATMCSLLFIPIQFLETTAETTGGVS